MPQDTVLVFIVAIIGLVVASTAGYYIVRFMRGSIKLDLPRTTFGPGDTIAGSFELLVKRPIQGNTRSYLKWPVEARLDPKGVDLAASKKVTVNVGSLM